MEEKKMDTAPQLSLDTQEVPTLTLDLETAVEQDVYKRQSSGRPVRRAFS